MRLTQKQFLILTGLGSGAFALGLLLAWRSAPLATQAATPENIWEYIEEDAPLHDIDPRFVYAICMAESSLNPTASSGYANGMMQLSKVAWKEVSDEPYRMATNWHTNVNVGIDYLEHCKVFLEQHGHFSYPLLAACYHKGPYAVKNAGFQIKNLETPQNKIYQQLYAGKLDAVSVPEES